MSLVINMDVSIIVPVYNVAPYIEASLQSVIRQTYNGEMECILVDDCGTDESMAIAERMIEEYNDSHNDALNVSENEKRRGISFRILCHEKNRGLSAARNTGTRHATGDYIYYLDSDDEITPDCIEKLVEVTQKHPEAEMVIGNIVIMNGVNEKSAFKNGLPPQICSNEEMVSYYHKQLIPINAWNKLMKRSFVESNHLYFKEEIIYEDFLWMFFVVKYLSVVYCVQDVTYRYYVRPGSILTGSNDYAKGKSYSVIYDGILHNLTPGRESAELSRYVEGFCRCYLQYNASFPAYITLFELFRIKAKHNNCWFIYTELMLVHVVSCLGIPLAILAPLNVWRWKMKRWTWKFLLPYVLKE